MEVLFMEEKIEDRNASPSAYGWDFQVGAGIILMLENIKDFTEIKMEGKNDDIELTFPDGKIFAQAKSVSQIGDQRNASSKLNSAIETFKDDLSKNPNTTVLGLFYVSNLINPLSSKYESAFDYGNTYDFSSLSVVDQQNIIKKLGTDFPVEKLKIKIIRFFGEGDNKWSDVKKQIDEFLRGSIDDVSYDKRVLNNWVTEFITNCADKPKEEKELTLSKRDIIFPIMVLVTENAVSESAFSKVSDYDDFEGLNRQYRNILYRKECDYQFMSKVIGDYLQIKKSKSYNRFDYVKSYWNKYESDFLIIEDSEEREALIKLSILSILLQKSKIEKIRSEANL
jgi:hypothetical protein